jgi:ribosomal-protein-serine acetyltransferase
MSRHPFNCEIELRLVEPAHSRELFLLLDTNRAHLRAWHPWVDQVLTQEDMDRRIADWFLQLSNNRGFHCGIWHEGRLIGVINHLTVDWSNRSTFLSYWLAEAYQGRGLMTAACRRFIRQTFDRLELNRITIECATGNRRSRAIPERLGFRLEGVVRSAAWLHDRYVDHAFYGLLRSDLSSPWPPAAVPDAFCISQPDRHAPTVIG